jgi:ribosomal protein S18 acetylase RimI-like enzyme
MLEYIIELAKKRKLTSIYLHVQISNEAALAFYKKFGFEISQTIPDYYKRIQPAACHVLQLTIVNQ